MMYQIADQKSATALDVAEFIDLINESAPLRDLFDSGLDIFISRAPGRLDVMGGIADYSGSLVLEMPIADATLAAVQKTDEKEIKIVSKSVDAETALTFQMELLEIDINDGVRYYDRARERFSSDPTEHWAAY